MHVSHTIEAMVALTVRFHAGKFFAEADVTVPRAATLAELLDDLTTITDAPRISRPWQPATLSGSPISATTPLSRTSLDHGDIVVFQPQHARPQPLTRDAAESMAYAAQATDKNITSALLNHGVSASAFFLGFCALLPWLPLWVCGVIVGGLACLVCLWKPQMWLLAWCGMAALAGAACVWVGPEHPPGWATGIFVACVGICLAHVLSVKTVTVSVVAAALACGALLGIGLLFGQGAATIMAAHILLLSGPAVSTATAGLHVPRLPSAGQPLELADPEPNATANTASRADSARKVYNGLVLGVAGAHCVALIVLLRTPPAVASGWIIGLCTAITCATLIHAVRHTAVAVTIGYSLIAATSLGAAAWLSVPLMHPYLSTLIGVMALAGMSLPVWLPRIGAPQPTHLVWWERLESICLAAIFPLSLHIAGVFALIRNWGA